MIIPIDLQGSRKLSPKSPSGKEKSISILPLFTIFWEAQEAGAQASRGTSDLCRREMKSFLLSPLNSSSTEHVFPCSVHPHTCFTSIMLLGPGSRAADVPSGPSCLLPMHREPPAKDSHPFCPSSVCFFFIYLFFSPGLVSKSIIAHYL